MKQHIKTFRLFENPDILSFEKEDVYLRYNDEDARSFGYLDDKLIISNGIHSDRLKMKFAGRVWIKSEIITFWDYPKDYKELKKVLVDIENESDDHFKITDNWKIEVVVDEKGNEIVNQDKAWGSRFGHAAFKQINTSRLIRIGDYKGSSKRSAEELSKAHTEVGSKKNTIKGLGSRKYQDKLSKGSSTIEYKHKKSRYKFTESFDSFNKKSDEQE